MSPRTIKPVSVPLPPSKRLPIYSNSTTSIDHIYASSPSLCTEHHANTGSSTVTDAIAGKTTMKPETTIRTRQNQISHQPYDPWIAFMQTTGAGSPPPPYTQHPSSSSKPPVNSPYPAHVRHQMALAHLKQVEQATQELQHVYIYQDERMHHQMKSAYRHAEQTQEAALEEEKQTRMNEVHRGEQGTTGWRSASSYARAISEAKGNVPVVVSRRVDGNGYPPAITPHWDLGPSDWQADWDSDAKDRTRSDSATIPISDETLWRSQH